MIKLKERQIIAKFYDCKADLMDSEGLLKTVLQAIKASNMRLRGQPQVSIIKDGDYSGVSILALVVESHFVIHTWSRFKHAWVDIATCGGGIPEKGLEVISSFLSADEVKIGYKSTNDLEKNEEK